MNQKGKFPSRLRVALYSHDTQGLGHIRRNLAIASTLIHSHPRTAILLISGTHLGPTFDRPKGIDFLTLPAVAKDPSGRYHSRSLALSLDQLVSLRASTIRSALEAFAPDVLIVDKVAGGFMDELLPALESLARRGRTRCVLGLRDILDDPQTARLEWQSAGYNNLVRAYYEALWVYGDPRVYDLVHEYGFEKDIAAKVRYTGYLNRATLRRQRHSNGSDGKRLALCMVGGGEDGGDLALAFARAQFPAGINAILITGPYMPAKTRNKLHHLAAHRPQLQILEFVADPLALLCQADHVIAMGGYNSVCEILAHRKRALIVPRVKPRQEQWIRSKRLEALGLLDVLHPNDLTPQRLSQWLAGERPIPAAQPPLVDLNGLAHLPHLLRELVEPRPAPYVVPPATAHLPAVRL